MVVWIVLLGVVAFSIWRLNPSIPDAQGFSTPDAIEQLRFLASETRVVGSPHHEGAREFIRTEFEKLGYEVQIQSGLYRYPLQNILARKPGTAPGNKGVMLAAHYDSVRAGPGAGDDGAAVVALLQVAKILSQQPHRNDIFFCITDGEEYGLLGAHLLVQRQHPWLDNVAAVLNFDARGSSGPSIMYETSENAGWLIDLYAKYAPHPVCSSASVEVYKRMPNGSDFTVFRDKAHLQGLNFAFIGGVENYHRQTDDVEHLDPRSLRHEGLQALALAQVLADMDLTNLPAISEQVYFSLASAVVVHYSIAWVMPLSIFSSLSAVAVMIYAFRRKAASLRGVLVAAAIFVANLLLVVGLTYAITLPGRVDPRGRSIDPIIAVVAATAVVLSAGCLLIARWTSASDLALVGLFVWLPFNGFFAVTAPGASYLTNWPVLAASVAVFIALSPRFTRLSTLRALLLTLLAAGSILLVSPMVYLSFLGLGMSWAYVLVVPIIGIIWLLAVQIRYSHPCQTGVIATDAAA
jgi:hypothetical protein